MHINLNQTSSVLLLCLVQINVHQSSVELFCTTNSVADGATLQIGIVTIRDMLVELTLRSR